MGRTVAFIPVRGGSKGIPHKNVKEVAGKPLVMWTAEAAAESEFVDKVYIATDSPAIAGTVIASTKHPKIACISTKEMDDRCFQETPMLEFSKSHKFDNIILIQATSPLLETEHITGGLVRHSTAGYDSVLSVVKKHQFLWRPDGVPINYDPQNRKRRQDWDGYLVENGAFYITTKRAFLLSGCRVSGSIGFYEMPAHTHYEIDTLKDFVVIEHLLKERTWHTQ